MTHRVQCDELLLSALRDERLDTVDGAFGYGGGDELHKANLRHRRRTRVDITDAADEARVLYLKRYSRERFCDVLRRVRVYGWATSPAGVEFANIVAARRAGVPAMEALIYGDDRTWLGHHRSYLVMSEVPGEALERTGEAFFARHGVDSDMAETLTIQLAMIAAKLHDAGYVHRDFYASHVFLDERDGAIALYLIDLARMFKPRWRRFRWRVKDLAQLKYSMPADWVAQCWWEFLSTYLASIETHHSAAQWRCAIDRKVQTMQRRGERKARAAGAEATIA